MPPEKWETFSFHLCITEGLIEPNTNSNPKTHVPPHPVQLISK